MNKIPTHTKAAILTEQRKELVVDNVELPKDLSFGQVLVELQASGICGSQLGEIDGVKGKDKFLPHLLGHEGFGRVLKIGPGVKFVNINDNVVLHWRCGSGIQSETPKYNWHGKTVNAGWVTTFNQFAVVSENRCTVVDSDIDPDIGSLFGCAVTTGFGVVENNAKIKMGESVVVFGSGGIGLNIIQAASIKSAYPIIAVDIFNNRLNLAKKYGATHCFNSKEVDIKQSINESLGTQNLDIFIDNTGNSNIIELGYELIHAKGRLILVGVPKQGTKTGMYTLPLHFGKTIIGSHGGESIPQLDIPRYLRIYKKELLSFHDLVTNYFKLDDINTAIEEMRSGRVAGRVVIKF